MKYVASRGVFRSAASLYSTKLAECEQRAKSAHVTRAVRSPGGYIVADWRTDNQFSKLYLAFVRANTGTR